MTKWPCRTTLLQLLEEQYVWFPGGRTLLFFISYDLQFNSLFSSIHCFVLCESDFRRAELDLNNLFMNFFGGFGVVVLCCTFVNVILTICTHVFSHFLTKEVLIYFLCKKITPFEIPTARKSEVH